MKRFGKGSPDESASAREGEVEGLPFAPDFCADICLLLEGTWPYVRGGVSSWVAQLMTSLPELTFSVIFLGGKAGEYDEPRYPIPGNVRHIEVHALLGAPSGDVAASARRSKRATEQAFVRNATLHDALGQPQRALDASTAAGFTELSSGDQAISEAQMQTHPIAWETIRKRYEEAPPGLDFNHYFWSVRSMHEPLFVLGRVAANAPPARAYHSVSTGYAGWLGAMIKSHTGRPYLISEHGIYTKERELDLAQVSWIPAAVKPFRADLDDGMGHLRQLWIRFFQSLGRMSYGAADSVFTLYEGNRQRQLLDGAAPHKLRIIPNGVDVARFAAVRATHSVPPPVLALIGRVVPIKDIKTFIRAMRIIRTRLPDAEGWLLGPEDEDPAYTDACKRLVANLGLQDTVRFLGFGKPEALFPKVGLNVLTSVSEGQPLTMLEGFAAGVPALVTDVGSCRELVEGAGDRDRAWGHAGAVVPIASPALFADAALALLTDREAWSAASHAAIQRVETRYDERDMVQSYGDVYRDAMAQVDAHPLQEAS